MEDEVVLHNGQSLRLVHPLSSTSIRERSAANAVARLLEIIVRDGWVPIGDPEIEFSDDEGVVTVTQDVNRPGHGIAGLIGTSLMAQTHERLRLAKVLDHPGESGRAREEAIRHHIAAFLPGDLGLETGFVVDGIGGQSRQIDLILFRRGYYPVFQVNSIPIVPIEAVVAVFEVKANVGSSAVLKDCYDVLASVKGLDRSNQCRNRVLIDGTAKDVDPVRYGEFQFQVLAAVVAERSIKSSTWFEATRAWCAEHERAVWPNFFVSASEFVGTYEADDSNGTAITTNTNEAHRFAVVSGQASERPLEFLTHEVLNFARVAVRLDYLPTSYLGGSHNLGVESQPLP